MPRNSSGVYSLPASNPVIPFTTIATSWANPTLSDIASELTNSLDRTGRGGMLAPFRIFDGSLSQPGLAFANEIGLGLWRSAAGTMQLASLGVNLFRIEPGQAVSPTKFSAYGTRQDRVVGQNWWETKVDVDASLIITPSATVNAEDFAYAKSVKFAAADGSITVPGNLTVAGGVAFGGLVQAQSFATNNANTNISMNIKFVAGAWQFIGATGFGTTRNVSTFGFADYLTTVQSAAAGSAATIAQIYAATPLSHQFLNPIGIVGAPRRPTGEVYQLDIHSAGALKSVLASDTGGMALKWTIDAPNSLSYFDNMRMQGDGTPWAVAGLPLIFRQTKASGALETIMKFDPSGLITIGDVSQTIPGAITSTYKYAGAVSGALDMTQCQNWGVAPGSNITSINMATGQVARITVVGSGAITLPAAVKLSIGSAGNFGTVITVINLICYAAGTANVYATIVPF